MDDSKWAGCLYLADVPAWALKRPRSISSRNRSSESAQDPFIVLQSGDVVGASRTPRRKGVELGMTKRRAQALCPKASVCPRDPALEHAAWEQILKALNQMTPRIESVCPGLAWFEPVQRAGLREWLRETPFQCGLARQRFVARLAAWKAAPGRLLRIESEHRDSFFQQVPVEALTEIGFDETLAEQLKLFGYPSVGAAANLSEHHLAVQFGDEGKRLADFLAGGSGRVSFYSPPPSVDCTCEFEQEIAEPGPLKTALQEASETVAQRTQGKAFQRVVLRLEGRKTERTTSRVLVEPRTSAGELHRAACTLLEELLSGDERVQALEVSVSSLTAAGQKQASLFFNRPELRRAVAAMHRRHPGALLRAVRDPEAAFEEERFEYDQVSPSG